MEIRYRVTGTKHPAQDAKTPVRACVVAPLEDTKDKKDANSSSEGSDVAEGEAQAAEAQGQAVPVLQSGAENTAEEPSRWIPATESNGAEVQLGEPE